MEVGDKLNPQRSYRKGFALKGLRQHIIKTSAEDEINKRDALSELAFSGRHRNHSLWVLTQKYNSVSKGRSNGFVYSLQKIAIALRTF